MAARSPRLCFGVSRLLGLYLVHKPRPGMPLPNPLILYSLSLLYSYHSPDAYATSSKLASAPSDLLCHPFRPHRRWCSSCFSPSLFAADVCSITQPSSVLPTTYDAPPPNSLHVPLIPFRELLYDLTAEATLTRRIRHPCPELKSCSLSNQHHGPRASYEGRSRVEQPYIVRTS